MHDRDAKDQRRKNAHFRIVLLNTPDLHEHVVGAAQQKLLSFKYLLPSATPSTTPPQASHGKASTSQAMPTTPSIEPQHSAGKTPAHTPVNANENVVAHYNDLWKF